MSWDRTLPDVPIWKRGQRLADHARDFALLFDAARTAGAGSKRERAETAARVGRRLAHEARAMSELLEALAAQPAAPAPPPPRRHWQDREE